MDRKSILILLACFGLVMALGPISRKLFPDIPAPAQSANTSVPPGAATNAASETGSGTFMAAMKTAWLASPDVSPAQELVVSSDDARYTFTPDGGGLELVELTKYPTIISKQSRTNPAAGGFVTLNTPLAAPTLAICGIEPGESNNLFTLRRTATGVQAEKTYADGLFITKEFEPDSDYLIHTSIRFENTSKGQLYVPTNNLVVGTAVPLDQYDKGVGLMWYKGGAKKTEVPDMYFHPRGLMCTPLPPRTEYRSPENDIAWAVAENQYFVLAAMPTLAGRQIIAWPLNLLHPGEVDASPASTPGQEAVQTVVVYPGFWLAPGQTITNQVTLYAGPKEYKTLARIAGHMENNLDLIMGFGMFGFVSKALLLTMNGLHALGIPYGWVIITMTVILKLLLWPFTAASMRTAKAMAALQPETAKLKEKYKDDPLKLQQKTNELWKEHGVHPLNGCLPTAIQIPIFIGFFFMIRTAIELRGAHFLWISDLSRPDTIFTIPALGFVPFIGTPGIGLHVNILPILYITTALWQSHVQPPSPGMDPAQQRLMRWMPLMFLAILYNYSSGLALYMMVSNLLTILQTKVTRHKLNSAPPTAGTPAAPLTYAPKKA